MGYGAVSAAMVAALAATVRGRIGTVATGGSMMIQNGGDANSCLTCRWLSAQAQHQLGHEPLATHKWHECKFPIVMPKAIRWITQSRIVNIEDPYHDCPTWVRQEEA